MKDFFRLFAMICTLFLMPAAGMAGQGITVFAAASLKGALDEVAAAYGPDVVLSYGGSGLIARQVAQGAPADVILLANAAWMDWLDGRGATLAGSRTDLLGNTLVLVGPSGAAQFVPVTGEDLLVRLGGGRLAIGQTLGVPAGIYGRQWLENAGLWDDLSPHLAEVENVRAALALVSRGEAPLGVVYGSDARADAGVDIVYAIPAAAHGEIVYPVAAVKGRNAGEAAKFIEFLGSNPADELFRRHGFLPLGVAQ